MNKKEIKVTVHGEIGKLSSEVSENILKAKQDLEQKEHRKKLSNLEDLLLDVELAQKKAALLLGKLDEYFGNPNFLNYYSENAETYLSIAQDYVYQIKKTLEQVQEIVNQEKKNKRVIICR